jgi:Zn-dependent M28 family amino/carboxypeptidase
MRAAWALLAVLALAGCEKAEPPVPDDTASLRTAATAHLRALARIGERNDDTRAAGTPGYDASVAYVAGRLRDAGYRVRLQDVRFPVFRERSRPRLETSAGRLPVKSLRYSGPGRVRGASTLVGLGCERGDYDRARGRIAVAARGQCTFRAKAKAAEAAGARGLVVADAESEAPPRGSLGRPGIRIPVVGAGSAGLRLRGRARLVVDTVAEEATTRNVVAERPGAPRRVAMMGAHLDSVDEGPGINDNGSGVAVTLALAERLRGRRGLRFGFWGAEELGLYGSRHYVASLAPAERRRIAGYVNLDMVGSPNAVRYVYGAGRVRDALVDALRARDLRYEPASIGGSSDHAPFQRAGIPVGGLYSGSEERKTARQARAYGGQAGRPLDPCYHRRCDTLGRVDVDVMVELGGAAGSALTALG